MEAPEREELLRNMLLDLVEKGNTVDDAEEIIENNLEYVADEARSSLVNILREE
ncbi:MAG: hypothetical protein AABZ15_11670 [Nitrospirota bacterium]